MPKSAKNGQNIPPLAQKKIFPWVPLLIPARFHLVKCIRKFEANNKEKI